MNRHRIIKAIVYLLLAVAVLGVFACMGGCSYATYEDPAGHKIVFARNLMDTNLASATIVKPDGTRIEIRGYSQKINAEAIGTAVGAALKAAGGVP